MFLNSLWCFWICLCFTTKTKLPWHAATCCFFMCPLERKPKNKQWLVSTRPQGSCFQSRWVSFISLCLPVKINSYSAYAMIRDKFICGCSGLFNYVVLSHHMNGFMLYIDQNFHQKCFIAVLLSYRNLCSVSEQFSQLRRRHKRESINSTLFNTSCNCNDVLKKAVLYSLTFSIMYFTPGLFIVLAVCQSQWKFLNYQNYSWCTSCTASEIFRWPQESPEDEQGGIERKGWKKSSKHALYLATSGEHRVRGWERSRGRELEKCQG